MRFTTISMTDAATVDARDAFRRFGPAYEVSATTGAPALGVVWREATVDGNGRDVKVWWWARKAGARMKVLRESSTRIAAASLLK